MELSIIIVSYNTKQLLKNCLESIRASGDTLKKEIIVVDNNSSDGSLDMVKAEYPEVKRIINTENTGFAVANNQGAAIASGEYLLLLNSDTVIKTNTLERFVAEAKAANADIASVKLLNPDGTIQPQGGALPNLFHLALWMWFIDDMPFLGGLVPSYQNQYAWRFNHNHQPGWVGGTAMLIKNSVYETLSGLAADIFMYGEDVELCLRARKAGFRIHYFASPEIIHLGQGSGNKEKSLLGEYQGIIYLYKKHYPQWQLPITRFLLKSGAFLRLILFGIMLRDNEKQNIYRKALDLV
jgi:GT2 family glycosyltransferase